VYVIDVYLFILPLLVRTEQSDLFHCEFIEGKNGAALRSLYSEDGKCLGIGQLREKRLKACALWIFHAEQLDCMLVVDHSMWCQTFFWRYLPAANTHISKRKKLQNGSIIGFTLWQKKGETTEQDASYIWIDPTSMVTVHGGF
jgi:hypothetical protein